MQFPDQHGRFSSPWDYEHESRSRPVPENTRYGSLGQQNQALSHYINSGYSDLYHTEAEIAAELQRQIGPQNLSSKQSHQFGTTATNSLLSSHVLPPFFH